MMRSLKNALEAALHFMVHHPKASAPSPTTDRYCSKAGLYTYLPDSEEQRDWLERTHRRSVAINPSPPFRLG